MKLTKAANLILEHELCSTELAAKLQEFLYNLDCQKERIVYCKKNELLRELPMAPKYKASSFGKIYSTKTKRYLKPFISNSGYEIVSISTLQGIKKFSVHRLICLSFRDMPDYENPIVDHIDGNKLNNHVNNLRWSTNSFNQLNRYRGSL